VELESHDVAIEADPGVHLPPADVADHVVDMQQACGARDRVVAVGGAEAGQESAVVILALDERVKRVAVSGNHRDSNTAVLVFPHRRLLDAARAATCSLAISGLRVIYPK